VERCIVGLEGHDAAIAAARVTDTVKEVDEAGRVVKTVDRSSLWAVQTPQVFNAAVLRRALDQPLEVLAAATDDAALIEAQGGRVRVIEAPPWNIKVTNPHDLDLVVALRPRC
jgi:2-C-methyl-D-erythritol 4-phosphate cytidylyltransferase